MRKFLKNKKGVTILEGLIALTLLALVATGTFSVLLSTSRKSQSPDIREEMSLAVDSASRQLQMYVVNDWSSVQKYYDADFVERTDSDCYRAELCSSSCSATATALQTGVHDIACLLPPICDAVNSKFYYEVTASPYTSAELSNNLQPADRAATTVASSSYKLKFHITCNGFSYEQ